MRISDWSSDVCSSDLAKASETGHGTNVIQGLAVSLESTALPTLVIVVAVVATYQLAGVIGIAFAATSMLALAGRSEEHTSELQSLMRISYAVFCLKKKKTQH